jgi:outer membrane PBP1 activator LpoA protein
VALLVPLSGPQRPLAEALRDGFLAAWLADDPARRPSVRILDEAPDAAAAYRQATAAGAGIIVGPLLKPAVMAVLEVAGPVTTLALNELDAGIPTPANFYQYGLAPEDEAREVARRAVAAGQLRALALAPDSDWGRRLLGAFLPALEGAGGSLRGYRFYDPGATDFTALLQRLLLLDESRERHRQLTANLGIDLSFEPRRREDVDFIFLAANTATGRLLRPQLRFLYAGDIPTYSTSAIFTPGSTGDMDLDGLRFTDAPALIGNAPEAAALRSRVLAHWEGGGVALLRFHAMGHDAYRLVHALGEGNEQPFAGLTGVLSTDEQRRIRRRTSWAEFRDGGLVPLAGD